MALRTRGEQLSMVDHRSTTYRPRRAFIEAENEPAKPEHPAGQDRNKGRPVTPPVVHEEPPKPLYRDQTRTNGWYSPESRAVPAPEIGPPPDESWYSASRAAPGPEINPPPDESWYSASRAAPAPEINPPPDESWHSPASRAAPAPEIDPPTDETSRLVTSPHHRQSGGQETTAILPRSRPGQHRSEAPRDAIDDYGEDERKPLSRRAKLMLLIGALSIVMVIGFAVGYAVLTAASQSQGRRSGTGTSSNASQPPGQTDTAALTDDSMLNPSQARLLVRDRTWKVELTERNPSEDAPTAACFGGEPLEGQPPPQQKILHVLNGGGKNAPKALHEAMAYSSPNEAAQAYAIASKTLGSCAISGLYIQSGHAVSGVGDQAAGVVVMDGTKSRAAHSVVVNQTGRVVNVIDATQPSQPLAIAAVARALGDVNKVQCDPAGGECGGVPSVKDGPPPPGGDERGFLATGDLPPAGAKPSPWTATPIELPKEEFKGSQCEKSVNWATVSAKSKSSRVYLSGAKFFGLNEIVLTTKDAKTAAGMVDKLKSDLTKCEKTVLTATVSGPKKVTSVGAQNTKITGWTATVSHKSTLGKTKFRVGIVAAGPKVVYTFLNPQGDYDFSAEQWDTVALRAGERATQQ
jgi:hypothetical protein